MSKVRAYTPNEIARLRINVPSNNSRWIATLDRYRARIQKLAWELEKEEPTISKRILEAIDEESEASQEGTK